MMKEMFTIQSYDTKEENLFGHTLRFDETHAVFASHFPGNPIVPGAVLVDVMRAVATDILGVEAQVVTVKNAKFITVIVPKNDLLLKITTRYTLAGEDYLFKSVIADEEKIYAKFDLLVKGKAL